MVDASEAILRISDISHHAGVSVSTVRVWEAQGLLSPVYTPTGHRTYRQGDLDTAIAIKRMRTIEGMNIPKIKAALALGAQDELAAGSGKGADAPSEFGAELRRLRLERRLTIKAVAEALDIRPSLLASVERTSLSVDIPLLKRLSGFYGLALEQIMGVEPVAPDKELVMREHGVVLARLGLGVQIERLGSGRDLMDCQRWKVDPGVHSNGSYRHEGEEFLTVVSGEFEVTIENTRVHLLTKRDTIYFKSNLLHSWRNPGREVAELIWVCVGDTF